MTEVKKRKRFISPTGSILHAHLRLLCFTASLAPPECHHLAPAGEEYSNWQAASDYLKTKGTLNQTQRGVLPSLCLIGHVRFSNTDVSDTLQDAAMVTHSLIMISRYIFKLLYVSYARLCVLSCTQVALPRWLVKRMQMGTIANASLPRRSRRAQKSLGRLLLPRHLHSPMQYWLPFEMVSDVVNPQLELHTKLTSIKMQEDEDKADTVMEDRDPQPPVARPIGRLS